MKKILSLVLALCMALCMVSFASAEEVPTLKIITLGNGQPDNYSAWIEHLNPYIEEKIGAKLDVECIGWGDWGNRRSVIINSNEPYDVIFGDSGNLVADVSVGAYLDITDLLADNAPGLLELIPAGYWDACRVGGRIYGVPTYKDSSITQYFVWDVELLKELGMEEAAMNCHTLADATPILKAIKEKTGTASFPVTKDGVSQIPFVYDGFGAGLRGVGVRYDDQETKVVKIFEQQDVMDQLKIVREWFESGIINADAANLAEGPTYKACFLAQGWSSAAKTVWGPNMGKELVAYTYGPTILSNDSVLGSVNFVSVNSEHPDKALAFLNLMNTDSKVRDAFYYGLEGDNFTYTEDGRVHKNPDSSLGHGWLHSGHLLRRDPHRRRGIQPVGRSEGTERAGRALRAAGLQLRQQQGRRPDRQLQDHLGSLSSRTADRLRGSRRSREDHVRRNGSRRPERHHHRSSGSDRRLEGLQIIRQGQCLCTPVRQGVTPCTPVRVPAGEFHPLSNAWQGKAGAVPLHPGSAGGDPLYPRQGQCPCTPVHVLIGRLTPAFERVRRESFNPSDLWD